MDHRRVGATASQPPGLERRSPARAARDLRGGEIAADHRADDSRRRVRGRAIERPDVLPVAQHRHPIAQPEHLREAMRDVEDRDAARRAARPVRGTVIRFRIDVSAVVGSSSTSTRQSNASARATCTSWPCAADSRSIGASGASDSAAARADRACARASRARADAAAAGQLAAGEDVAGDGEVGERHHLLIDHADARARARRAGCRDAQLAIVQPHLAGSPARRCRRGS